MAAISLLTILYWGIMIFLLPWSLLLILLLGFWFILMVTNFIIYDPLDQSFHLEEKISEAFPEQTPCYETDEEWLRRKSRDN